MMRHLVCLGLLVFGFPLAVSYGNVWNMRVHPLRDIKVEIEGRGMQPGVLSRTWDRGWVFTAEDGGVFRFDYRALPGLEVQVPSPASGTVARWREYLPVLSDWRSYLPPALFWVFLSSLWCFWPWTRSWPASGLKART